VANHQLAYARRAVLPTRRTVLRVRSQSPAPETNAVLVTRHHRLPRHIQPAVINRRVATMVTGAWRRHRLETVSVALLVLGGLIFPAPIWLVGFALWLVGSGAVLWSKRWNVRDKWLSVPGLVVLVIVGTGIAESIGGRRADLAAYGDEALSAAATLFKIAMLLTAVYLARRATHNRMSSMSATEGTPTLLAEVRAATADEKPASTDTSVTAATRLEPVPRGRDAQVAVLHPAARATGKKEAPGHVFISYVREDSHQVDQLQSTLHAAGIPVWRDTADLWPGEDWRAKIRSAINDKALVFLACFSARSLGRARSYQNEELVLAIEQLRLRPPDHPWLIPVRFDDCQIPDRDIGGGRTLSSIQRADLFGDRRGDQLQRLTAAILRILGQPSTADTDGTQKPSPPGAPPVQDPDA
jgi:TIR domain